MRRSTIVPALLLLLLLCGAATFLRMRPDDGPTIRDASPATGPGSALFGASRAPDPSTRIAPPAGVAGPALRGSVVDGNGHPLAGAEVAAAKDGEQLPSRATTDAEGRFAIPVAGDPEARWLIGARHPGFAPSLVGSLPAGGPEIRIVLRPGARLRGSVRDGAGAPCPGARVRATLRFPGVAKDLGGFEVLADEEGSYSFEGLSAVEGRVEATSHGISSGEVRFDFVPGVAESFVDLQVDAGLAVEGTVRGPGGEPLEGIWVAARRPDDSLSERTQTGPDGRYRLGGLKEGAVEVHVTDYEGQWLEATFGGVIPPRKGLDATLSRDPQADGHFTFRALDSEGATAGTLRLAVFEAGSERAVGSTTLGPGERKPEYPDLYGPHRIAAGTYRILLRGGDGFVLSEPFTVERGAATDLGTLRLGPGVVVRGRVLGPAGAAVEKAILVAGEDIGAESVKPDPEGRFSIPSLPSGKGILRVLLPRCEVLEAPWSAGPGETSDLGDLRLRPATGTIRGIVRTASGKPVEGARVGTSAASGFEFAHLESEARTGPDGRFEIREVPAGRWRASATLPGASGGRKGFAGGHSSPVFALGEGETREFDIRIE